MSEHEYRDAESGRRGPCYAPTDLLTRHGAHTVVLENGALPQIYITLRDWERIFALVCEDGSRLCNDVRRILIRELDRAIVCPADSIPRNVVTINSCVLFRRHIGRALETRTLVCAPIAGGDPTLSAQTVSVATPLGAALLGLPARCHMPYVRWDGTPRMLALEEIVYQPEAHRNYLLARSRPGDTRQATDGAAIDPADRVSGLNHYAAVPRTSPQPGPSADGRDDDPSPSAA
jgi:regulator of nucleoside diphosphate kinase